MYKVQTFPTMLSFHTTCAEIKKKMGSETAQFFVSNSEHFMSLQAYRGLVWLTLADATIHVP